MGQVSFLAHLTQEVMLRIFNTLYSPFDQPKTGLKKLIKNQQFNLLIFFLHTFTHISSTYSDKQFQNFDTIFQKVAH